MNQSCLCSDVNLILALMCFYLNIYCDYINSDNDVCLIKLLTPLHS